jgi:hypothetical protein
VSKLDGDRATAIYDALEGMQGTIHHLAPETRKAVAGHLARALPAVPPTTTDRDRIAAPTVWIDGHPQLEAIAAAVWESCRTEESSTVVDDPRNIAVAALAAVLGMLPAGSEDTTTTRAATLRAEAARIRAHCPDHLDSNSAEGAWMACHCDVADDMERRLPEEAHPAEHKWAAELYDPLAEQWVPGTRYADRDRAVKALAHGKRVGPAWKDGTPTERRLVRTTTTYTVEAEHQPAAASAGVQTDEETSRG